MSPISPFGWKENAPPDIDPENLEADRQQIGAFAEQQATAARTAAETASDPAGSAITAETKAIAAAATKANAAQSAAEGASDPLGSAATAQTNAIANAAGKANAAQASAEAASIPLTQKAANSGVASLTSGGIGAQPPAHHATTHAPGGTDELTLGDLPVSVVSGSLINAKNFATGNIVNMTNLVKAMEEERKGAYFPENMVIGEQVLLNKAHAASPSTFQYAFIGLAGTRTTVQLPVMVSGQFAFRINENAEGIKENEALYNHPDVTFQNIEFKGSGSADGGSVASAYNRSFRIVNVQCKSLANGFVNKGFSDLTYIDSLTGDNTNTGWLWQGENGDGQQIHNIQAYGSKGIFAKHGSGTCSALVSGEHKFIASKWVILDDHLEGDGPNTAGGKAQNPLIILEGGDYIVKASRLFTLTNPNRPCIEVNDEGQAERFTLLTMENVRFMQRLDNPANPTGRIEPIGNLQGFVLKLVGLSTKSVIKSIDTHAECFQQTSEESQFDVRSEIGMRVEAPAQAGLQEQFTNRRVVVSCTDWVLRYNTNTASWELRPPGGMQDSITTRRFSQPALNLSQFAAGTAEAKAAPTTRSEGKHYYNAWAIDDRGHKTQLSVEKNLTLVAGGTPVVQIEAGYPCRVLLQHSLVAATFTSPAEWVEIALPLGQAVLADMGNAIGGQEWTKVGSTSTQTGLPRGTEPTTTASENNTAFGYQGLDSNGRFQGFGARPTTGEWQKEGDSWSLATGAREHCTASASANNGGTWTAG